MKSMICLASGFSENMLSTSSSRVEWTVSGYVLVLGVFPLAMGRLGDILGRRKVYLFGLVVFTAASALCGLAQTIEQLIAFRLLTGQNYWTAEGMAALIGQIVYEPMEPPTRKAPHLGPRFDEWFARACNREPDQRFARRHRKRFQHQHRGCSR